MRSLMTGSGNQPPSKPCSRVLRRSTGGTLVVANGVYGERMARMLSAYIGRPHELLQRRLDGAARYRGDVTACPGSAVRT